MIDITHTHFREFLKMKDFSRELLIVITYTHFHEFVKMKDMNPIPESTGSQSHLFPSSEFMSNYPTITNLRSPYIPNSESTNNGTANYDNSASYASYKVKIDIIYLLLFFNRSFPTNLSSKYFSSIELLIILNLE